MPTLIMFIGLAIALAVTLAVIVLIPWFQAPTIRQQDNQLLTLNIDVFKQRLAELEQDYQAEQVDKITYDNQKLALERQLLEISDNQDNQSFRPNWKSRLIFIVWIPFLTAMAYLVIADRKPVFELWQAQDKLGQVADDLLTAKIDTPPAWATKDTGALVNTMQTNVHHHATDPMRWFRLSEVYLALQAPDQSIEALSRAYRLKPDDEQIAITYAQTRFFTQGGQLDAETRQVLQKLLTQHPNHQGAQMLMAMGEMRDGHYTEARNWVAKLKTEIQSRPGDHTKALQSLNELEQTIETRQQQGQNTIGVQVRISPEMLAQVKKGETLFINVRNLAGGPPVAAKKLSAEQLSSTGLSLSISDNDSIMPTLTLSQAIQAGNKLVVTARISQSGEALPQSGDLSSDPVPLATAGKATDVMIDKVLP